jgi:chitinase
LLLSLLTGACGDQAVLVIEHTPVTSAEAGPVLPPGQLAVDWGQDLFGNANPNTMSLWEKPLADACTGTRYDFMLLDYVVTVANGTDGKPTAFTQNFANHCSPGTALAGASGLAQCDDVAMGIDVCHRAGKKVLISVGGPTDPGLGSDQTGSVGEQAAQSMWDVYLGGHGSIRPFSSQVLDGVNLEFPPSFVSSPGAVRFAGHLRELMNASGGVYYLTATPQCPYPDAALGPDMGTVIGDNSTAFDALFVQYFNPNPCDYSAGTRSAFLVSLQSWATLTRGGRPSILVGLPLIPTQAGYVDRLSLPDLVNAAKSTPAFGGLMLRDESFDQNSADTSGLTYGAYAKTLLP